MSTTDDVLALSAKSCVVHPLVLLSIQDHFHRVAKNTRKRVVGILLGPDLGPKGYNVSNSFAGEHQPRNTRRPLLLTSDHPLPSPPLHAQCHSRRMTRTRGRGSSTTTTSRP